MDKKIFGVVLIATMAVAASWNFNQSKNEGNISDSILVNIESLAACETSSNNLLNTGFCVQIKDSSKEVCSTKGDHDSPRCSGTI